MNDFFFSLPNPSGYTGTWGSFRNEYLKKKNINVSGDWSAAGA
jgi:hypothetical protein